MFPSFKSVRDRKNKLKQLAEENSEELQLARIKNDRYKLTQWATFNMCKESPSMTTIVLEK